MGVITGYPDDASTTDSDKFLTSDSSGATKLTSASTLKNYIVSDGSVTSAKIDYASLAQGILTYNTYGTTGGQVINASAAAYAFNTFTSNGNSIVTNPSAGLMRVTTAGYYTVVLNSRIADGGGTPTWRHWIEYSADNVTWYNVTPQTHEKTSINSRGESTSGVIYLAANAYVRGYAATSGALRFAAQDANRKSEFSLALFRVG